MRRGSGGAGVGLGGGVGVVRLCAEGWVGWGVGCVWVWCDCDR